MYTGPSTCTQVQVNRNNWRWAAVSVVFLFIVGRPESMLTLITHRVAELENLTATELAKAETEQVNMKAKGFA